MWADYYEKYRGTPKFGMSEQDKLDASAKLEALKNAYLMNMWGARLGTQADIAGKNRESKESIADRSQNLKATIAGATPDTEDSSNFVPQTDTDKIPLPTKAKMSAEAGSGEQSSANAELLQALIAKMPKNNGGKSGSGGEMLMPKMNVKGMEYVDPTDTATVQQNAEDIKNKMEKVKGFQKGVPDIDKVLNSLDQIESKAKSLPDFKAGVGPQLVAGAQAGMGTFAQDPKYVDYMGTVSRELPGLVRGNIGTSNRINTKEIDLATNSLGKVTTPLNTKLDLIKDYRGRIKNNVVDAARDAGIDEDTLSKKYPAVYNKLQRVHGKATHFDPPTGKYLDDQGNAVSLYDQGDTSGAS